MGELIAYKDEAPFDRRLFSLSIPNLASFPPKPELTSPNFVLLLACDARVIEASAIATFASSIIDQGIAYLCAWGPDCERVHDIFDEVHVMREIDEKREYPRVMTTWHNDESLDEALWYMLNSAYPYEALAKTCKVDLAVSVANDQWTAHIQRRLSNMRQLNEDVLSEEAS
jgi:hypothetical protein